MEVYFYLSRKRANPKGLCPIYGRVKTLHGRKDFSTGIFIEPENWGDGWPLCNVRQVANRLSAIADKVYKIIADCERADLCCPSEVLRL